MFESLSDRLSESLKKLTGRGVLRPEDVETALKEVRMALLEADVNYKVVREFGERIRTRMVGSEVSGSLTPSQQVVKVVHDELMELLGGNAEGLRYADRPPTVLMLVGLQGSGKTTTAVKLALAARREGHRPMVVALDLRRPAAIEQLRLLAEREHVRFHSGKGAVEDIAREALAAAARGGEDVVILDTAGRQTVDEELMDELRRLRTAVPVSEALLVADAMTGQEAVTVGRAFHDAVQVGGVVLTKLDGDARGGAALSLKFATGQTVRFAGVGEKSADLEIFHADRMASRILGMGDRLGGRRPRDAAGGSSAEGPGLRGRRRVGGGEDGGHHPVHDKARANQAGDNRWLPATAYRSRQRHQGDRCEPPAEIAGTDAAAGQAVRPRWWPEGATRWSLPERPGPPFRLAVNTRR
jgi:signal recognition particle subunit SRP54